MFALFSLWRTGVSWFVSMFVSRLDLTRHSVSCAIAAATAGTGAVATDIEELNATDGTESSSSGGSSSDSPSSSSGSSDDT